MGHVRANQNRHQLTLRMLEIGPISVKMGARDLEHTAAWRTG